MKKRVFEKQKRWLAGVAVVVLGLFLAAPVLSAPGGGQGPPEGKGNDSEKGVKKGEIYGDLWVVVRDVGPDGDGEPVLFQWTWPDELYVGGDLIIEQGDYPTDYTTADTGCVQPVSSSPITGVTFTYDNYINSYGDQETVYLIPLDDECKIPDAYAETWGEQVAEVESGRLNLSRTSQLVIDAAYEEALGAINEAAELEYPIRLDAAGRLVLGEKTIDSPRENMALYQRLMLDGCFTDTNNTGLTEDAELALSTGGLSDLVCANPSVSESTTNADLLSAASFLAGAGDKFGSIGIDMLVYFNNNLGINDVKTLPNGSVQIEGYFDFGLYSYDRSDIYDGVVKDMLQPPVDWVSTDPYPETFYVYYDLPIYTSVFSGDWDSSDYPIVNFVRSADDALSVIFYIHNFELPELPVDPVR